MFPYIAYMDPMAQIDRLILGETIDRTAFFFDLIAFFATPKQIERLETWKYMQHETYRTDGNLDIYHIYIQQTLANHIETLETWKYIAKYHQTTILLVTLFGICQAHATFPGDGHLCRQHREMPHDYDKRGRLGGRCPCWALLKKMWRFFMSYLQHI